MANTAQAGKLRPAPAIGDDTDGVHTEKDHEAKD